MRKSNIVIALVLGLTVFSACSSLNNMVKLAENQQVDIVPNPLELHGDSVKYDMAVVLPAKMLPEKYQYKMTSFYKAGESDVEVGTMTFDAADFPDSKTTTSRKSESFAFLYDPSMDQGNLEVIGTAVDEKGENKSTPRVAVAQGLITTSTLVEDVYYTAFADPGYTDEEELTPTNVSIFFDRGSSVLKRSETRSSKGKEFSAFIADKNVTKTVTITGTHSPEGLETVNSKLSENRAKAIEDFYRGQMRKYDYKDMADSIKFILKPVVEDWTEFKDSLDVYEGVTADQKSEILKIVNGAGTFEDKEKALQKLDSYSAIFKDIYPGLRAARTEALTVKEKKSNAEITVIAKQIVDQDSTATDSLSINELLFAATLTPSLEEKEAIYLAATKQEGVWQAHNNLGATYLAQAIEAEGDAKNQKIELALTQLEIAANKKNAAEVQANMATAYALQGNAAQAFDAATAALANNPGNHKGGIYGVKGAIEVKKGDYEAAVASLGSADETTAVAFDKGLALLLLKEFENAETGFDSAIELDADFAKAHYALAITAARQGNADDVLSNLKTAVEKDPSLKEKALADLEFRTFATQVTEALN
ncbi:OmpA family protein [Reichenbachiella agariperforans]|uniref:OmpA family protein n=1 Tax=Reichenbachiella agariperforans TaxID=156994 RepID=A0A1M6VHG7_REIAG|nr:OmpA family protein [Reichenbachiella agariperforans]SHK80899.1 OmpA family protein [Reichenbachiella agariperforans]